MCELDCTTVYQSDYVSTYMGGTTESNVPEWVLDKVSTCGYDCVSVSPCMRVHECVVMCANYVAHRKMGWYLPGTSAASLWCHCVYSNKKTYCNVLESLWCGCVCGTMQVASEPINISPWSSAFCPSWGSDTFSPVQGFPTQLPLECVTTLLT